MKRTIALTALALTVATGVSALPQDTTFSDMRAIERYAPGADVSALDHVTVRSILNVINGGESEGEKRAHVKALLMHAGG